jgi:hypothetical protein
MQSHATGGKDSVGIGANGTTCVYQPVVVIVVLVMILCRGTSIWLFQSLFAFLRQGLNMQLKLALNS